MYWYGVEIWMIKRDSLVYGWGKIFIGRENVDNNCCKVE